MQSHAEIQKALADCDAEYGQLILAAQKREQEIRATAFYEKTVVIAGVPCRPMTLADFRILTEAKNVFFTGAASRDVLPDCVQFLWWQSLNFSPKWLNRRRFMARMKRLSRELIISEVRDYLSGVWQDMPATKGSSGSRQQHWCYEASIIDSLAARYGWSIEYIMALPMAQIRAFSNIIHTESCAKRGEEAVFTAAKSVHLKSEWLAKHNNIMALSQTETVTS